MVHRKKDQGPCTRRLTAADADGMRQPAVGATPAIDQDVVELRDGARVRLHPMRASDAAGLLRFHATLSPETTYFRFFSVHPSLSDQELHRFTHVDHTDREAIVATAGDEIIGVARFDRMDDPSEAEVAFVVADAWQELGLGTAMFRALSRRAKDLGLERFVAEVLPHNRRMLTLFHHSGLPARSDFRDGAVHLVLDL
jgi:RimJ/RimL family protein N-acetyltransferase